MRAFVIFALIAVAYARPDVSLGYNYEQRGSHHLHTPGLAPPLNTENTGSHSHSTPTISVGGPSFSHAPIQPVAAPVQHFATPAQHISAPVQHSAAPAQHFQQTPTTFQQASFPSSEGHLVAEAPRYEAPIITKQFYLHSAPEDHSSVGQTKHFVLGRAQKNYRVVFIKSPSSSNANVHLSAEYAPQEEKTVIYVLSQKEHELDVNDIATPAPTQPSKPEVFFIKYKTPEEAAHAQSEIQRQYDVLGGQSHVSDEGAAPISSVVGSLGQGEQPLASSHHGTAAYLPPHH